MTVSYSNAVGKLLYVSAYTTTSTTATASGLTVSGTTANDSIADVAGGDTLSGGAGDDTYYIVDTNTKVVEAAGGGDDTVVAYVNHVLEANVENITAGSTNVTVTGNALDNILIAKGTSDVLIGGAGNDVLIDNGAGMERFLFSPGDGQDVVMNFKTTGATHDFIGLGAYGFTSFAQIQSHLTQVGADTLLSLSTTDSVLLKGVTASTLTAADFLTKFDPSTLKMTFDDEFNSLSLYNSATGTGTWKTNLMSGAQSGPNVLASHTLVSNGNQQVYVDPSFAGSGATALGLNPFSISNGVLTITASKTPAADASALWNYQYTSGILTTEKSFAQTYGYFEIKAELPTGQGAWPAFYLLPADGSWPPELDVMEQVSGASSVFQTDHSDAGGVKTSTSFTSAVAGDTTGFHTYGMLWTASTISWYIDGVETAQVATPADMNKPMYLLVDLEAGGGSGVAGTATFNSASYQVDYVRAYSLDAAPVTSSSGTSSTSSTSTTTTTTTTTPPPVVSDELDSAATATLGATQHILTLTGSAAVDGTGNDLGDTITGNAAMNHLTGGAGNDILKDGGGGGDIMTGGAGDDSYYVNDAHDTVVELPGGGHDTIYASVSYTLPANVEDLVLTGTANLTATGNSLVNHLTGNDGNNILISGGAGDIMAGGKGDDTYYVYSANDVVIENPGEGNDTIYSTVSYTAPANVETLILTGTANLNATANDQGMTLVGNAGTDTLTGGAGNDILTSGKGVDTLIGGAGDDTYYVNNAADVVVEGPNGGNDTVITGSSYTLPDNVENLVLLYAGSASGTGNALDNHITGNDGANKLFGMAGNDVINGGAGNDVINGGTGDDILTGGAGNDTFQFSLGAGHDTVTDFGANGDHDVIDISAYLAKNNHPTITDAASGLTLAFASGDTIHLLGVHPNQLIQTTTGFTI